MRAVSLTAPAGLTQLDTLALLAPHDPGAFAEGFRTVPSDAALRCLTRLTQLQLQARLHKKSLGKRQLTWKLTCILQHSGSTFKLQT